MNNTSKARAGDVNGVTVDIYEDGKLKIYFNDPLADANPLDKILVNDVPLLDEIDKRVFKQYNPLYGKKLAVVGDSLTVAPSVGKSYSSFIAQRNNMILVNKGKSGQKLCGVKTNDTTGAMIADRLIVTYTNDIPSDADFILVQIGTNDSGEWWKRDETADPPVPDTDMSTNTFKGC